MRTQFKFRQYSVAAVQLLDSAAAGRPTGKQTLLSSAVFPTRSPLTAGVTLSPRAAPAAAAFVPPLMYAQSFLLTCLRGGARAPAPPSHVLVRFSPERNTVEHNRDVANAFHLRLCLLSCGCVDAGSRRGVSSWMWLQSEQRGMCLYQEPTSPEGSDLICDFLISFSLD